MQFQIINYRTGKSKTVSARSMNSIYAQYKRYCFAAGAKSFTECDAQFSFGNGYWMDANGYEYILRSV